MGKHGSRLRVNMDGSISGIYKLERGTRLSRPLFSVSAPAGFPSPASDYIEGRIDHYTTRLSDVPTVH